MMDKISFLTHFNFPPEWDTWGLYPEGLFSAQTKSLANGQAEREPSEHVRYGAFQWWLRTHPNLSVETLIQLARLAVLDPDCAMADAALRDILTHSCADEQVLQAIDREVGQHAALASRFSPQAGIDALAWGRTQWTDVRTMQEVFQDYTDIKLTDEDLRRLHASGGARTLRALVEHPALPTDLLTILAGTKGGPFAREIRSIAIQRLTGQDVALSDFSIKCSVLLTRGLP